MGEKETSAGRTAGQNTEGRPSDGSGLAVADAQDGEDPDAPARGKPSKEQRTSNLNLSKSNINRTTEGDPDFDLMSERKMAERDSETQ